MKRIFVIHCWGGTPQYCWYPSIARAFASPEFEVHIPAFPDTENPQFTPWLSTLRAAVGKPTTDTYLVGHSLGCVTILRYLESLPVGEKIGGAVFVAGFTESLGFKELKSFFAAPFDFDRMKAALPRSVAIFSDNDPYVPVRFADVYREKIGSKIIIKKQAGHFSGPLENEDACLELPDVVSSLQSFF